MQKQNFWNSLLLTLVVGSAFIAGYITNELFDRRMTDNYELLYEAREVLENNALFPLPERGILEYGMIRGMLEAYGDPYTIFLEPPQHELQINQLEGTYGGIGVKIERGSDGSFLLYPFLDSPAAKAGILNGDRLISVDDLLVDVTTPFDTVEAALRGPVEKEVQIVVARSPDNDLFEFNIKRAEVAIPSVIWHPVEGKPRVGLMQVNLIADTTADELVQAIALLKAEGVAYFIIDLRGNGGGLLDAAVETTKLFLDEGIIISQQYKGKDIESFSVNQPGPLADLPLVILVDQGTASAAEIFAGALQAHKRAILIGEPTFGKNTIQLVFPLQDGSSLHVTAANWWFPDLNFPGENGGLLPDLELTNSESGFDRAIQTAVDLFLKSP